MTPRLLAMTCGWLTGPLGNFLAGEHGKLRVPVPAFLIDHPRGKVVFDTGLHADVQHDAPGRLGDLSRVFTCHFEPGEELAGRLRAVGCDPAEVRWAVNSHLHFDHTGGNAQLPNATFIHQRREWEAGADPDQAAANFYDRRDYDLGHQVVLADGEHDVFGDGSVVCFPTPGHTPGHQSLRVRLGGRDVVLTGDSCYLRQTLENLHLPPLCHDREASLASLRLLRELQSRGARLVFGHDPEAWASVPQAPACVVAG
jgi:glyoxylase-like metal-dependent hydrolase (beta-lactamase superfamily II)